MTRNHFQHSQRAYELLEIKARILRMAVSVAGGFVLVVLISAWFH